MILIIDDDSAIRSSLSFMLKRAKYEVETASGPKEAIEIIRRTAPQLILMDMNYSLSTTGEEGLELLRKIKIFAPAAPVILMTAWGSISLAVEGMRLGAFDFITKPWDNMALMDRIRTALHLNSERQEEAGTTGRGFDKIIGNSPQIKEVLDAVTRVAPTGASVLITGESGTGKELIAEAIHLNSPRSSGPFVKVNLGGLSSSLFDSEMFGHKKGAFTDAWTDRKGRFELADKGTIFLDEIGDMSLAAQAKVLRVLQENKLTKVGGDKDITVNVRVVAATNKNLKEEIEKGNFREDLYHRISVIVIRVPSLAERREDIPMLIDHFIKQICQESGKPVKEIDADAVGELCNHAWSGNIRELRNVVERLLILSNARITKDDVMMFALPN